MTARPKKKKRIELLRQRVRRNLRALGLLSRSNGALRPSDTSKATVRALHANQKRENIKRHKLLIEECRPKFIRMFANGNEVEPIKIRPELELVEADTWQSKLFRYSSLTWSVPVSEGFGRRMRFLVWDRHNDKLMGIIAVGDPVFNLKVRDEHVGWNVSDRHKHLVHVFDAFVLGALPPYNQLLGGKLIACLVRTTEMLNHFMSRYSNCRGLISRKKKKPQLVMVTTSSALGRSSMYSRLALNGRKYFESVGFTRGWGHFHMPESLFAELRILLRSEGHPYADNHKFGEGPNWRLRTIREGLKLLGMDEGWLKHGVEREVFVCKLATNASDVLLGRTKQADYSTLLPLSEVAELAKERWVIPRAERLPTYRSWKREDLIGLLGPLQSPVVIQRED